VHLHYRPPGVFVRGRRAAALNVQTRRTRDADKLSADMVDACPELQRLKGRDPQAAPSANFDKSDNFSLPA